jgi:hypothetical protein
MKKILMLLGVMILVSGLASANAIFVQCAPAGSFNWYSGSTPAANGSVQTGSISCTLPASLPGGDTLTSVEVYYLDDYGEGSSNGTTIQTNENAGAGWGTPNQTTPYLCVTTGNFNPGTGPCISTGSNGQSSVWSTETTPSFSSFTMSVTSTLYAGGNVGLNSQYDAIVELDYTTPAPEPASFMMVGGGVGLLGLAQVFGKFLKKKRS